MFYNNPSDTTVVPPPLNTMLYWHPSPTVQVGNEQNYKKFYDSSCLAGICGLQDINIVKHGGGDEGVK